jgi:hypothetical protein
MVAASGRGSLPKGEFRLVFLETFLAARHAEAIRLGGHSLVRVPMGLIRSYARDQPG